MKTTQIKLSKTLLAAGLAMGALSSHADWIVEGPASITVTPGESGSSIYQFTAPSPPPSAALIVSQSSSYQVEGSGLNLPINSSAPITSYIAAVSPVGTAVDGNSTFDITVDWTISSNPSFVGDEFAANYMIDTDAYGEAGAAQNITISAVAAPEPAQTVAGAMLLSCGGLMYARNRWLKKNLPVGA